MADPNPWLMGPTVIPGSGVDSTDAMRSPGSLGINQDLMAAYGIDPTAVFNTASQGYGESFNPDSDAILRAFNSALDAKGLHLGEQWISPTDVAQQVFDAQGNPVGQRYTANVDQDPGNLGMMIGLGMLGGFTGATALTGGFGGAPAVGNGAFLGEGAASGVPAWDAAASGAGLDLAGGAGAATAVDPYDYHLLNSPGPLGNMGGAGTATIPSMNLSGGSTLTDLLNTVGKNLAPGKSGIPSINLGGIISGGMSPGDRYRQQLLAQTLREKAAGPQYSGGPGWIPATGG